MLRWVTPSFSGMPIWKSLFKKIMLCLGTPGWLSGLPLAQVMILGSWDRVLHRAPHREPASPSACVSTSLCVSLMNK